MYSEIIKYIFRYNYSRKLFDKEKKDKKIKKQRNKERNNRIFRMKSGNYKRIYGIFEN